MKLGLCAQPLYNQRPGQCVAKRARMGSSLGMRFPHSNQSFSTYIMSSLNFSICKVGGTMTPTLQSYIIGI